jgi:hypothetical protein
VKRRTMGNIKLIGELYKQKMIPEKIVHACLQQLLGDPKADPIEENTEALVHLLTTVSIILLYLKFALLVCFLVEACDVKKLFVRACTTSWETQSGPV